MRTTLLGADLVLGLGVDLGENLSDPVRDLVLQPAFDLGADPGSLLLGLEIFVGEDLLAERSHCNVSAEPNKKMKLVILK